MILHGWGANAQDVASLIPLLNLSSYHFLCPDGPFPHPYNPVGRMWYSFGQNPSFPVEAGQGLSESRDLLRNWLKSLPDSTGIPLSHTILGGFSQGGAMTLDVGLDLPLAGLISLSGYGHQGTHPQSSTFPPVLIAHGKSDTVVPLRAARDVRDRLIKLGAQVTYQEFEMAHDIRPETLLLVRNFILQILPEKNSKTS